MTQNNGQTLKFATLKNVYHIFEYCAAGSFVVFAEQECAQMFNVASVRIFKRKGRLILVRFSASYLLSK